MSYQGYRLEYAWIWWHYDVKVTREISAELGSDHPLDLRIWRKDKGGSTITTATVMEQVRCGQLQDPFGRDSWQDVLRDWMGDVREREVLRMSPGTTTLRGLRVSGWIWLWGEVLCHLPKRTTPPPLPKQTNKTKKMLLWIGTLLRECGCRYKFKREAGLRKRPGCWGDKSRKKERTWLLIILLGHWINPF